MLISTWFARERAWYCMRGLLPRSPSTTTAALRRVPIIFNVLGFDSSEVDGIQSENKEMWTTIERFSTWNAASLHSEYISNGWRTGVLDATTTCRNPETTQHNLNPKTCFYVPGLQQTFPGSWIFGCWNKMPQRNREKQNWLSWTTKLPRSFLIIFTQISDLHQPHGTHNTVQSAGPNCNLQHPFIQKWKNLRWMYLKAIHFR